MRKSKKSVKTKDKGIKTQFRERRLGDILKHLKHTAPDPSTMGHGLRPYVPAQGRPERGEAESEGDKNFDPTLPSPPGWQYKIDPET